MPDSTAQELVTRLEEADAFAGQPAVVRAVGEEVWIGLHDRWLAKVARGESTIVLWFRPMNDPNWRATEVPSSGLDALFDQIAAAVSAWARRLTPVTLVTGATYRVVQPFRDFHGNDFAIGEHLTFASLSFLPHDDGHTLRFTERSMWLQDGSPVHEAFGLYVEPAGGGR